MSSETRSRLVDAGWSLSCDRYIELDISGESRIEKKVSTWRASKGTDEVVVRARLGDEQTALAELYKAAKTIDADLRQMAIEAGSGAWVIDLSQAEFKLDR